MEAAREKYGVNAPAITGNRIFERRFRVQQNTLEQLIVFIPGLYLFAHYVNPLWAAVLGLLYLVGREIYSATYVKDPAKRSAGFGLSAIPPRFGGGCLGGRRSALFRRLRFTDVARPNS